MTLTPPSPALKDDLIELAIPGQDDVPAMVEACNDPEIPRWTAVPTPYRESDAREFLATISNDWENDIAACFTYRRLGKDRLDGMISVSLVAPGIGVVGYWTAPWARGNGLATRALEIVVAWSFRDLDLNRVDLATMPGNIASERVAQKAGFTGGRVVPKGFNHNGVLRDVRLWQRPR